MKTLLLLSFLFFMLCSPEMKDINYVDRGIKKIDKNLYIQKLDLDNGDRIYCLIDSNGNLAGKSSSLNSTYPKRGTKTITLIHEQYENIY